MRSRLLIVFNAVREKARQFVVDNFDADKVMRAKNVVVVAGISRSRAESQNRRFWPGKERTSLPRDIISKNSKGRRSNYKEQHQ